MAGKKKKRSAKAKPKKKKPKKKDNLISCAEFARLKGVSVRAVYKAIDTGRISCELVDGKRRVEPKAAFRDWDQNTKEQYHAEPAPTSPLDDDVDGDLDGDITKDNASGKRRIAETKKLIWDARQAKLKFLREAGELVSIDKVRMEAFDLAKIVKDRLLSIPNRISAELVGITDQAKMHGVLTCELNSVLQELVRGLEGLEPE